MVEFYFFILSIDENSVLERRAVYSFLDTLYKADDTNGKDDRRRKSLSPRLYRRANTAIVPRQLSSNTHHESRASKRDLGEVLETLER
jgi:hypothetical protein